MTTYEQLLADCIRWAKEAGRIQLELFRSDRLDIEAKFNDSDVVTNADKASEKAIISEIRRAYPEHSVLSEEAGCDKRMNDWLWVIDPLDGTTNYSSGLPNFCVSIGVQHKGQTVVGVVYAPYLGEIFTAVRGKELSSTTAQSVAARRPTSTKRWCRPDFLSTRTAQPTAMSTTWCVCCPTSEACAVLAPLQSTSAMSPPDCSTAIGR